MKVLHIGQMIGGIGIYIRNTIIATDSSVEYIIVSGKEDGNDPVIKNGTKIKEYKIDLYRSISLKDIKGFWQIIRIVKKEKPDVIHCHSAKGGFLGRWSGFFCGKYTLYTPHAYSFLSSQNKWKKRLFLLLERFSRLNSYMLACSESERKLGMEKVNYKEKHALVWSNSVPDVWEVMKEKNKENSHTHFNISYVGRPSYQKNTYFFLMVVREVVKRVPNVKFHLLGVGYYSPYYDDVIRAVNRYELGENIEFVPWLTQEKMFEYMVKSDIYLTVSRYEGLPLAVIEAMSLGCPIVASDVFGNRDCIWEGENGYLLPMDSEQFAAKISYLYENDDARKRMGECSRELFHRHFCMDSQIKKLVAVYRKKSL